MKNFLTAAKLVLADLAKLDVPAIAAGVAGVLTPIIAAIAGCERHSRRGWRLGAHRRGCRGDAAEPDERSRCAPPCPRPGARHGRSGPPGSGRASGQEVTDAAVSLNGFTLDALAPFTRERSFPTGDSQDFRVFYVGRDDVHGILRYLLARCSRSLRFNQFGYDDDELDGLIRNLVDSEHVFVQGTLDKSQAGGVHERKILAGWDPAMRNSFAVGQSATHQISQHTGVIEGARGRCYRRAPGRARGVLRGYQSQNNTLAIYLHPVQVARFIDELDHEHAVALAQQNAAR